jgi:hypothetical protein
VRMIEWNIVLIHGGNILVVTSWNYMQNYTQPNSLK